MRHPYHNAPYHHIRLNKADASSIPAAQGTQWQQVSQILLWTAINVALFTSWHALSLMGIWLIESSHTAGLHSRSILRPTIRTSHPQTLSSTPNSTKRSNQALKRAISHNQRVRQIWQRPYDIHVLACHLGMSSSVFCRDGGCGFPIRGLIASIVVVASLQTR